MYLHPHVAHALVDDRARRLRDRAATRRRVRGRPDGDVGHRRNP